MGTFFGSSVASKRSGLASSCCQTGFKKARIYGKFVFWRSFEETAIGQQPQAAPPCRNTSGTGDCWDGVSPASTSFCGMLKRGRFAWDRKLFKASIDSGGKCTDDDQAEVPRDKAKTWIRARLTDLTKASGMRYPWMGLNIYVWVLKFCKDRKRSRVKQTFPKSLEQTETLSGICNVSAGTFSLAPEDDRLGYSWPHAVGNWQMAMAYVQAPTARPFHFHLPDLRNCRGGLVFRCWLALSAAVSGPDSKLNKCQSPRMNSIVTHVYIWPRGQE